MRSSKEQGLGGATQGRQSSTTIKPRKEDEDKDEDEVEEVVTRKIDEDPNFRATTISS